MTTTHWIPRQPGAGARWRWRWCWRWRGCWRWSLLCSGLCSGLCSSGVVGCEERLESGPQDPAPTAGHPSAGFGATAAEGGSEAVGGASGGHRASGGTAAAGAPGEPTRGGSDAGTGATSGGSAAGAALGGATAAGGEAAGQGPGGALGGTSTGGKSTGGTSGGTGATTGLGGHAGQGGAQAGGAQAGQGGDAQGGESACSEPCTGATPYCRGATDQCVECLSSAHCPRPEASRCDLAKSECEPCQVDGDCAHLQGRTVCDAGQCVQCTRTRSDACGERDGEALVCDSLERTCTDETVGSSGLCAPCVSDAHCPAGQLCYQQAYQDDPVGYFCFWKQGDTPNGAPESCTDPQNRPFFKTTPDATSIDGHQATLCTLAVTTCPALNQFRSTPCVNDGLPDDELCGFAPGEDSKCVEVGGEAGTYLCTTVCLSDDDCKPGSGCDTTVNPNVCEL